MAEITLRKVPADSYQHAPGDKRNPTRYEVLVDGALIGRVESRSSESWRKSGRIRTSMIGYAREWRGYLVGTPSYREDVLAFSSRGSCIDRLVERWEETRG